MAKTKRKKPSYALEELLAGVTPENIHGEVDWGAPVGKEAWGWVGEEVGMKQPQHTLVITVVYSTEDKDYGPVYVATNDQIRLVTDGKTFEELIRNLRDALAVCLDDDEALRQFNLVADPRVVLMMELPVVAIP